MRWVTRENGAWRGVEMGKKIFRTGVLREGRAETSIFHRVEDTRLAETFIGQVQQVQPGG